MENQQRQLLEAFQSHLDEYAAARDYIDKAHAQTGKFSAATIERVIMRNEIKSQDIGGKIMPLVPELERVLAGLSAEIDQIGQSKALADEEMEELELAKVIGEISEEEFEEKSASFRDQLESAGARIAELDADLNLFRETLGRWVELAQKAGHETGVATPAAPAVQEEEQPMADEEDEPPAGEVHARVVGMKEDVSAMFAEARVDSVQEHEPEAEVVFQAEEEEISIEVSDASSDVGEEVDIEFGFDGELQDTGNLLGGDDEEEAEESDDSVDAEDDEEEAAQDHIELSTHEEDDLGLEFSEEEEAAQPKPGAQRRALLIYQEGTAEEQIYPFHGDQITIGRGRDNDIQIKNDSKVSRYHCKVYRRGDNFYIEDNQSSNGSLVNGELVTERRLFGGEEVIIGETFFRFRILE